MLTTLTLFFSLLAAGMPASQGSAPTADDFSWLAGCWAMPRADGLTEEHWMKPAGGTLVGMSRTVRGGRTTEFEYLRIAPVDGRLSYIAKPSGQAEAIFPLATMTEREVVFENPAHDFPQRIIYRRADDGSITARAEATVDGQVRGVNFTFRRCS